MIHSAQLRAVFFSLIALGAVGAVIGSATVAFYGDVERSTGNTFTTGGVDLKVASVSHYNNMICTEVSPGVYEWQPEPGFNPLSSHYPATGSACDGTWSETDLEDGVHKFFNFADLKAGDFGEDTIALTVYDNPAWGQFLIENVLDTDNTCAEPEQTAEAGGCVEPNGDGEIDDYLRFTAWLDQGTQPGFQCADPAATSTGAGCDEDSGEGDNIYQVEEGPLFWDDQLVSELSPFAIADVLVAAFNAASCTDPHGTTDYGLCHGLAEDGRMLPLTDYYFGLAWELPLLETGNEAQTDSYQADMVFMVEQHRNNPNPFAGTGNTNTGSTSSSTGSGTGGSTGTSTASSTPGADLTLSTSTLTTATGTQVNFVATVNPDLGFDDSTDVIVVNDGAAGGSFFNGTTAGACNSTTPDADNEFTIGTNKGVCYSNDVPGVYTITVDLLATSGGSVVDTESLTITVN